MPNDVFTLVAYSTITGRLLVFITNSVFSKSYMYTFHNFSRNLASILEVFGNCNLFLVQNHVVLVTLLLLLLCGSKYQ